MAEHLASIFGTEKDRVNCPFYFKIGACRHGDRCSRLHTKPTISPTLVLSNMYQRPDMNMNIITNPNQPQPQSLDPDKVQDHFDDFYEDLFEELSKYGPIQSLNICDNLADHMVSLEIPHSTSLSFSLFIFNFLTWIVYMFFSNYMCRWGMCTFNFGKKIMLPTPSWISLGDFIQVLHLPFHSPSAGVFTFSLCVLIICGFYSVVVCLCVSAVLTNVK